MDISNSAGSSDSAEESFILLNQMVLTGCVPCTPNTTFWCENVSVDCQTCLIGCLLSRRSCGYFKLWSGVRWRREPAWKRQLAVLVPSPTTDLGLADPILSLFEVFYPNFSAVQPKGLQGDTRRQAGLLIDFVLASSNSDPASSIQSIDDIAPGNTMARKVP